MNNEEIKKELLQIYECKHDFTVTQTGKKSQRVNGFYRIHTQEIFLHNKNFTTDNQLIYTAIHELTHHILDTEYEVKTARCHSGAFWSTFYNLLDKAVELGFYSRKRSDSVQGLIDTAKDLQNRITAAQKELGNIIRELHKVCEENGDRIEDVIEHDLQVTRKKAEQLETLSLTDTKTTDEMATVINSAKDLMIREYAKKAAEDGKTVEQVKAIAKTPNKTTFTDNGLESPEKLTKEKRRLETTIERLNDRLVQVEETLRSMTGEDI